MREDLGEIYIQEKKLFNKKYIYIFLGVVLAGIFSYYLFSLIWGTNSYEVYQALRAEKKALQQEVVELESKNVELQKIIFELKGLEPTKEENK
ncbi:hypothetical protein CQA62_01905 [Helicobacter cholecystus]|uniref:Uncharacterized protein n=1 Tax=Helicobacter cholecystus TaxID=45498 RepID=A0A3D8IWU0_9HELI|nr:septum formation initiator family protein [Helicobacter cholecystus]RDU69426.1 hypothetical protein CQA62_01905 [Helicobacter cholecystus]VEJ23974.1 Septum formation initiator [Helicobacter cholecystus]